MPNTDPLRMFWFLPTMGDGSYLGTQEGWRPAEFDYMQQIIIGSGYPHLEEAYKVAELLFPALGFEKKKRDTDIVGRDFVGSRLVRAS